MERGKRSCAEPTHSQCRVAECLRGPACLRMRDVMCNAVRIHFPHNCGDCTFLLTVGQTKSCDFRTWEVLYNSAVTCGCVCGCASAACRVLTNGRRKCLRDLFSFFLRSVCAMRSSASTIWTLWSFSTMRGKYFNSISHINGLCSVFPFDIIAYRALRVTVFFFLSPSLLAPLHLPLSLFCSWPVCARSLYILVAPAAE